MAKIGTLVTFPNYYRGQKALITASLSGAQYDLEIVKEEDVSTGPLGLFTRSTR